MKTQKVRTNFDRELDSPLAVLLAFIVTCMTNNVFFPNLGPTVTELAAAVAAFVKSLEDAQSRSKESIATKNRCRRIVLEIAGKLGRSINAEAQGDSEKLDTTGLPLTKTPGPRTIGNPGTVFLKPGISSGMLEASVKPDKPAPVYMFEITTTDPESGEEVIWISFASKVSKFVFTGLVPRKQYWVRVVAVGSRGQRVTGPVFTAYAA